MGAFLTGIGFNYKKCTLTLTRSYMKINYKTRLWMGSRYWCVTLMVILMFIPSYLRGIYVVFWELCKEIVNLYKEVPYKKEQYERYKER